MSRIREVSPSDMLAVVDGGALWSEIASEIARAGFVFPSAVRSTHPHLTAGEIIMGGMSAPTDGRFGGLREHILSLDIVTATGDFLHTGSRSVKDVGGYDIAGLILGEGGRFGMVTGATLRLVPAPRSRILVSARAPYGELAALARLIHDRMRPAFIEIYEGAAAGFVCDAGGGALLVGELQAPNPGMEDRLLSVARGFGGEVPIARGDEELERGRGDFERRAFESLDAGGGVIHCSFEPGGTAPAAAGAGALGGASAGGPAGAAAAGGHAGAAAAAGKAGARGISYRSLYPERIHHFLPAAEFAEWDPALAFLAAPGARAEVELLLDCNGGVARRRIHRDVLNRHFSAPGRDEPVSRDRSGFGYEGLWKRVLEVFDPAGIMLP